MRKCIYSAHNNIMRPLVSLPMQLFCLDFKSLRWDPMLVNQLTIYMWLYIVAQLPCMLPGSTWKPYTYICM